MPQNGTGYTEGRFQLARFAKFNRPDPMRDWDWLRPHTMNLYEYVGNDPVNMWDPTGFADDNSHMQWHEDQVKKIVTAPNEHAREQAKHNYEVGKIARGIGTLIGLKIRYILGLGSPFSGPTDNDDQSNNNDGSGQDKKIVEGVSSNKSKNKRVKKLYHKGELKDGEVDPLKKLCTGTDKESVEQLNRDGKVHEFAVPKEKYQEWKKDGKVESVRDYDHETGTINEERRILPPASGELNEYKVEEVKED